MSIETSLQDLFPSIPAADWWGRVEKDLKGKALESLNWSPEPGLEIQPFYTQAESIEIEAARQLDWHIQETILVSDAKTANTAALEALKGGAEALRLELQNSSIDWALLFADIHLSYIHCQLAGKLDDAVALAALDQMEAQTKAHEEALSQLSIDLQLAEPPSNQLLERAINAPYQLRVLGIQIPEGLSYSAQIASALEQLERQWRNLPQSYSFKQLSEQFHLRWGLSNSYFPELAKFRAFQHLWLHWLEAHGATEALVAPIGAYTLLQNQAENPYWDMIAATTQAMSAVIGGARLLDVTPAPLAETQARFARRVARNLQHLLKQESHLHRVIDPSAGSYYIETLSKELAQKAWQQFNEALS